MSTDHAINEGIAFPTLIYQGTKEVVGTRSLLDTFPIMCNLTTSQTLHPTSSHKYSRLSEQRGCVVAISPGVGMSLKVAPRGTEIFYQQQIFG